MGYACPVCGAEQADGVHLANHLAITASLGREDHAEFLDAHAPDWGDRGPEELADAVTEYAVEIETPDFESASGGSPSLESELARQSNRPGRGSMTAETEGILEEARELTRRRRDAGEEFDSSDGGEEATESEENA